MSTRTASVVCLATLFIFLPGLSQAGTLDGSCIVGNTPSATLLFPYFEVDLDDPDGRSTLIAISNSSSDPTVAKVVMWTDCNLPVFSFDVFLPGNGTSTISLRDVVAAGILPVTSPDAAGQEMFPGCSSPLANPVLDEDARAELQAQLTGQPSPSDGFCYGSDREAQGLAVGYLTVDALNDCSATIRFPDDDGYFVAGGNGLASNDNVLWGDYYLIHPSEDYAQGLEAVNIVADPDRFVDNDIRSFYQVTEDERDDRVPLSSMLRTRFLNGGVFDGSTQFVIWAQRSPELLPFTCGTSGGACPAASALVFEMDFYDLGADLTASQTFSPPAFVGEYGVLDLGPETDFGVMDLSVKGPPVAPGVGPTPPVVERQAWIVQTTSALGRFSVGLTATRLDDLCKVPTP